MDDTVDAEAAAASRLLAVSAIRRRLSAEELEDGLGLHLLLGEAARLLEGGGSPDDAEDCMEALEDVLGLGDPEVREMVVAVTGLAPRGLPPSPGSP